MSTPNTNTSPTATTPLSGSSASLPLANGAPTTTTTTTTNTTSNNTASTSPSSTNATTTNTTTTTATTTAAALTSPSSSSSSSSSSTSTVLANPNARKNIEYILLAEFDIDVGSKLKYQYPFNTGEDEALLAEFMLPDGSHKRNDDWTVFFLNRPDPEGHLTKTKKQPTKPKPEKPIGNSIEAFIYSFSESDEEKGWVMLDSDKLVVQFYQNHIHIYGKGNSKYSTKIEKHPDLEFTQLEPLFDCVLVDSTTALGVRFLDTTEEDIFLNHLSRMITEIQSEKKSDTEGSPPTSTPANTGSGSPPTSNNNSNSPPSTTTTTTDNTGTTQVSPNTTTATSTNNTTTTTITASTTDSPPSPSSSTPNTATTTTTTADTSLTTSQQTNNNNNNPNKCKDFLYCLNFMNNQKDDTVRRGAVVKSLAICTTHPFIHVLKPFMVLAMQKYFNSPSMDVIVELYNSLNSLDMSSVPQLNDIQKHILRASPDRNKHTHATTITYLGNKMPVYIPITHFPDEVGDYKVITLVQKFGNDIMKIFNGILSQKRIIFLGYGCSADEVCNYVLAACSMVCPPLKGIRERCFPYTNLCYLDFLSVPGYITGVTNPMFEEHPEWWDILCNIGTGKVIINPNLVTEVPDKFVSYDNDFMNEVNYNISLHYGEDKIKSLFQEYTQHIVDMALDEEEFLDEQSRQQALDINRQRIEAWTRTKTFTTYLNDKDNGKRTSAIRDHTILRSIRKLRKRKHVPEKEVLKIYESFLTSIKTEEQVTEFLSYLPKSHGGLFPVAVGLFHTSKEVRNATCELLRRLDKFQSGNAFISGLEPFLKTSYERNIKLLGNN
ncbi:hypothetical protein CYY_005357 [Polysphondylium violaceum]|uniref:UDENN domain-containing protein n=1 Tax=Polysphondylium violaceum TaxID=133409 RepID=A0A8J4PV73_9MYCE|nr:hypothetical protein CYY_005357 [Polysphondylium violaceum]